MGIRPDSATVKDAKMYCKLIQQFALAIAILWLASSTPALAQTASVAADTFTSTGFPLTANGGAERLQVGMGARRCRFHLPTAPAGAALAARRSPSSNR